MRIEAINDNNYDIIYNFLKSVPSINKIDDNILKNACAVIENDKIIGSIAFEEYGSDGLIRYFVFKKSISNIYLIELLDRLILNARKLGMNRILCVADSLEIEELFKELGFEKINKIIFLNEEILSSSNFSSSNFLVKRID